MKLTKEKYEFLKEIADAGEHGKMLSFMRVSLSWPDMAVLEKDGYIRIGRRGVGAMITDTGRARLDVGPPSDLLDGVLRTEMGVLRAAYRAGVAYGHSRERRIMLDGPDGFADWLDSLT